MFFKKIKIAVAFALCAAAIGACMPHSGGAPGDVAAIGGAVLGKKVVKDILAEVEASASRIIDNAKLQANDVVGHAGYQLQFVTQEMKFALDDSLDKPLKALDRNTRMAVLALYNTSKKIDDATDKVASVEDNLSLDVEQALGNIPFVDRDLVLKKIDGIRQVKHNSIPYMLTMKGSGLGIPSSNRMARITSLKFNGVELIDKVKITGTHQHLAEIEIPAEALNNQFDDSKLVEAKVDVHVEGYKRSWWSWLPWVSKKWRLKKSLNHTFYAYLFPRTGGEASFDATMDKYDWVNDGDYGGTITGPDNHCSGGCSKSSNFPLGDPGPQQYRAWDVPNFKPAPPYKEGNNRLVGTAHMQHVGGPGGFDVGLFTRIVGGGRRVECGFRPRTRPNTYRCWASKQRWSKLPSLEHASWEQILEFGKVYQNTFSANTEILTLTLKLSSGASYSAEITAPGKYFDDRIEVTSISNVGHGKVIAYKLNPPKGIQLD